ATRRLRELPGARTWKRLGILPMLGILGILGMRNSMEALLLETHDDMPNGAEIWGKDGNEKALRRLIDGARPGWWGCATEAQRLVDVFFLLQPADEALNAGLSNVRRGVEGQFHFFGGSIEISLGRGHSGDFAMGVPLVGALFYVDFEDGKALFL